MRFGEAEYRHELLAPQRPADLELVTDPDFAMRLGGVSVQVDLAALAHALRFRSRLAEAGDVEKDIEADGDRAVFHRCLRAWGV